MANPKNITSLKFLGLFLFFVLPLSVWAEGEFAVGTVQDETTGEPLLGVRVYTKSGKQLGTTNSVGRFEVSVPSSKAILIFKYPSYEELELDLGEYAQLIDLEISLKSKVKELEDVNAQASSTVKRVDPSKQSITELEQYGGMKIDLSEHLRNLAGISGMQEWSGDVSAYGGRNGDATHYLGGLQIPNLRHLDFGFPGNSSAINPRLLRSVTLQDNLSKGPASQGNSSALVYDLQEGEPEKIRMDLVLSTINMELNLAGYWGGRTFIASGRLLQETFLANLGSKFYTEPKDERLRNSKAACLDAGKGDTTIKSCQYLKNPIQLSAGDILFSTFQKDSLGAYNRLSFLGLSDDFLVKQDMDSSGKNSDPLALIEGNQGAWFLAYESFTPDTLGASKWGLSVKSQTNTQSYRDSSDKVPGYYLPGESRDTPKYMDQSSKDGMEYQFSWEKQNNTKIWKASSSKFVEFKFSDETWGTDTINKPPTTYDQRESNVKLLTMNALWRLQWDLGSDRKLDGAFGILQRVTGLLTETDIKLPLPVLSARLTKEWDPLLSNFGEIALRQSVNIEPKGNFSIGAKEQSSVEGKLGVVGAQGTNFDYSAAIFTRYYPSPTLPRPDVYWYYSEVQKPDFAWVNGMNLSTKWRPIHYAGVGSNASIVQGDYWLPNGKALAWEANRSLDWTMNLRLLPRNDSLVSIILTYWLSNGTPLYQYAIDGNSQTLSAAQFSQNPTVDRQRTDIRVNLDLKSKWKPLETMRFFFEATNIFSNFGDPPLSYLGGDNKKRRSWTRGDDFNILQPVVTRGMGLYIQFGLEGRLGI